MMKRALTTLTNLAITLITLTLAITSCGQTTPTPQTTPPTPQQILEQNPASLEITKQNDQLAVQLAAGQASIKSVVPWGLNISTNTTYFSVEFAQPMNTNSVKITVNPAVKLKTAFWPSSAHNKYSAWFLDEILKPNTTYTITLTGQDSNGNTIGGNLSSWSFKTANSDTQSTATVRSVVPWGEAVSSVDTKYLSAEFAQSMDRSSVSISVSPAVKLRDPFWPNFENKYVAWFLDEPLKAGVVYTVRVAGKSANGQGLGGALATWSFKTPGVGSLAQTVATIATTKPIVFVLPLKDSSAYVGTNAALYRVAADGTILWTRDPSAWTFGTNTTYSGFLVSIKSPEDTSYTLPYATVDSNDGLIAVSKGYSLDPLNPANPNTGRTELLRYDPNGQLISSKPFIDLVNGRRTKILQLFQVDTNNELRMVVWSTGGVSAYDAYLVFAENHPNGPTVKNNDFPVRISSIGLNGIDWVIRFYDNGNVCHVQRISVDDVLVSDTPCP